MMPMRAVFAVLASLALVTNVPRAEAYQEVLKDGERISNGEYLMVPGLQGNESLVAPWWAMQLDCNFVLYDQFGYPAWSSGTSQQGLAGSCYATVQDCTLLVYSGISNGILWNSSSSVNGTTAPVNPPCYATIVSLSKTDHTPAAVLLDSGNGTVWSSQ